VAKVLRSALGVQATRKRRTADGDGDGDGESDSEWTLAGFGADDMLTSDALKQLGALYAASDKLQENLLATGTFLLYTVTFYANDAHNLTRSP
jgi:hypothetical protein